MGGKICEGEKRKVYVHKKSIGQFFFDQAEKHGARTCQVDAATGKKETFSSVKLRSTRVAIELRKKGITHEDYIIFCSSNILDNIIPLLASMYLGAKVANLDPTLSLRHTKHLTGLVEPKMAFVDQDSVELLEQAIKETGLNTQIVVLGESSKHETLQDYLKPSPEESTFEPVAAPDLEDVAYVFFSSGSTGLPKAICLTHRAFLAHCGMAQEFEFEYGSFLHFTTLYWISGMFALISTFSSGGYRVLAKPAVDGDEIFQIIEKYKVSFMLSAPGISYQLTDCPNAHKYDTSSLKCVALGGTPMAPNQLARVRALLKNTTVLLGYGMTEAGFLTVFGKDKDKALLETKLTSCGKVGVGAKIKVVDPDTGRILGPNEKGELMVKTDSLMKGYLKMDSSDVFDNDGFLKTGDVGYYDEDECFYIVDRFKEIFKYKSWHIVPSSLEAVILEHPAVKEATVFGIPSGPEDHVPSAVVVLFKNSKATPEEIKQFVAERVLDREHLRGGLAIVDEIPKTPTGKVARSQIKDNFIKSNYLKIGT